MTHIDHLLPDYFVPHALTSEEMMQIEAHIVHCETCRAAFDDWQHISVAARTRQTASSLPPLRIPQPTVHLNGKDNPMTAIAIPRTYRKPQPSAWRTPAALLIVMLAGIIGMVMSGVLNQSPPAMSVMPLQQEGEDLPTAYEWLRDDGRFTEIVSIIDEQPGLVEVFTSYEVTFFAMPDDIFVPIEPTDLADNEIMTILGYTYPQADILQEMREIGDRTLRYRWHYPGCDICPMLGFFPYRIEDGEVILSANTRITEANIAVSNGAIHVIDSFWVLPDELQVAVVGPDYPEYVPPSIWDILREDERVSDFIQIFENLELSATQFEENQPLTLFVPVNGELLSLVEDGTLEPSKVMRTHVLSGIYSIDMLLEAGYAINPLAAAYDLVYEGFVIVETSTGDILLNGYSVIVEGDIITPIGIVHLIDKPIRGFMEASDRPDAVGRPMPTESP